MKTLNLKLNDFYDDPADDDWVDEYGNLFLCCQEAGKIFGLNRYPKRIKASVSRRRQVLKDGWIHFKRWGSFYVFLASDEEGDEELIDIYGEVADVLNDLGVKEGDSFWAKVERA